MVKSMKKILKLRGKAKNDFYQSKYEYYKKFNIVTLTASCFIFFILFVIDLQVYNYFEWTSVLRRGLVLIPLAVVAVAYHKTNNYKVMTVISFVMVHAIVWCNIWVTSCLPNMSHADEGFLIMGFILMVVSYSTPPGYAVVAQWGLVGDVILSDKLVHYKDIGIMVSYNCQVVILLCIVDYIATKHYYDHYITRKKLELALFNDPLTQVFNRNKLEDIMGVSHDLSNISEDISIMLVDIDYFKKVNDMYGHDEGDHMLKFIADSIKNSLRKQDVVIRWGGEEFVAIMTDCKLKEAYVMAERIRKEIAGSDNGVCKVTVSIGVARYDGGDCIETIKKADEALYKAKREGRNKVACYENVDG